MTLLFDTSVFGVTLTKTYGHVNEMRLYGQTTVMRTLLRDGALRSVFILILALIDI